MTKLKRRLRKKLHIGEFQEFGFNVSVKFTPNLSQNVVDKIYDDFIEQIEKYNLLFGGGGNTSSIEGFITAKEKFQSPKAEQREQIKIWLEQRPEISECEVGNFKDAWYD